MPSSLSPSESAKAYVETLLAPGDEVTLCSTKPDKYDRYLADVFVPRVIGHGPEVKGQDYADNLSPLTFHPENFVFLKNALLSSGHAVPYDGGAKK
jgi:endonuclease YncB( thermonuclease family)